MVSLRTEVNEMGLLLVPAAFVIATLVICQRMLSRREYLPYQSASWRDLIVLEPSGMSSQANNPEFALPQLSSESAPIEQLRTQFMRLESDMRQLRSLIEESVIEHEAKAVRAA